MVAAPQTYAGPVSYAAPQQMVTTSYAAPATTSYAAPATTSYAAPATMAYAAPATTSYAAPATMTYAAPQQMYTQAAMPMAAANYGGQIVVGQDLNRDGIPDAMQQPMMYTTGGVV